MNRAVRQHEQRAKVLAAIREGVATNGFPPTQRSIASKVGLGFSATNGVIWWLAKEGLIVCPGHYPRGLRLPEVELLPPRIEEPATAPTVAPASDRAIELRAFQEAKRRAPRGPSRRQRWIAARLAWLRGELLAMEAAGEIRRVADPSRPGKELWDLPETADAGA